jgi:hypothetical protein
MKPQIKAAIQTGAGTFFSTAGSDIVQSPNQPSGRAGPGGDAPTDDIASRATDG